MKKNCVFAGVSFPCEASEIARVAIRHGYTPVYLEHRKFASLIEQPLESVELCDRVPDPVLTSDGLFLPFLESWVTEGIKFSPNNRLLFDVDAAKVSRSKLRLASTLAHAGCISVPRLVVNDLESALQIASQLGYPVILRSDTGYSGRDVWVARTATELTAKWSLSQILHEQNDFREMLRVLGTRDSVHIVEPFYEGQEWSVDFIISPDFLSVIRIAEKSTAFPNGIPLCLGYRLTDCETTTRELTESVTEWARAIFSHTTTSFGCFDIRRNNEGQLAALDFATRLGGNLVPRLVRTASTDRNPYAAALDAALSKDPTQKQTLRAGASLIHVYGRPNSTFTGMPATLHGETVDSKPLSHVASANGRDRVASAMTHFDTYSEFMKASSNANDWIANLPLIQCRGDTDVA